MALTGCVCDLHTQHKYKCGIVRSCQVVADQPTYTMLDRDKAETKGTGNVGNQVDQDKDATAIFESVVQVDTR